MHLVGTQRIDRDAQRQGRIDAAGQADDGALEAGFADVIAHAEHQRVVGLGLERQFVAGSLEASGPPRNRRYRALPRTAADACGILVGIEGKGVAVENQLILAADQVAVNGRHARRLDAISQHLHPLAGLVEMAGRGVEDEQQFGSGLAGARRRPLPRYRHRY
jgi:hypothetical protein